MSYSQIYHEDSVFEKKSRVKKAKKIIKIISKEIKNLNKSTVLDIGCSTGLITCSLSLSFKKVIGVDPDKNAILLAQKLKRKNVEFKILQTKSYPFKSSSFDVIIVNQVYEHVKNPKHLMEEINRLLKPGGICFFGALNRLRLYDPHYPTLPFISLLPIFIANFYVKLFNQGLFYEPRPKTILGIKNLIKNFYVTDYTLKIIKNPKKFDAEDVINPKSFLTKMPIPILSLFYCLIPNYIFILKKY
ncbi:MAG TPA: methyltransferase domain-containing protein [Patescibacteria group bacterium]